ncbi:class I SAM-dependent methyltransferase [Abditibacterium utsteinense]|nr:class I SAM-dependent methyltransferase [Abditibacterium utsteinense]
MLTQSNQYTDYLQSNEARWKQILDVQRVYRKHLRSLKPGRVLDVGCGLGRHLWHLQQVSNSVGIDHNPHSVAIARTRHLNAFTPEDFHISVEAKPQSFDTLLLSHVLEHLTFQSARELIDEYFDYLRPNGRVIIMTPQELGFRSDATHVSFMDPKKIRQLIEGTNLSLERQYSFPLPRWCGRLFRYNEFVCIARKKVE